MLQTVDIKFLTGLKQNLNVDRILFLRDENAFRANDGEKVFSDLYINYDVKDISVPSALISSEIVKKVVCETGDFSPDFILAFGGGTVLDLGKLCNLLFSTEAGADDLVQAAKRVSSVLPMCAIPTTAGTGSEATHFAVYYIEKIKYSVAHPLLRPAYVILDPDFVMCMPEKLAISTGFDALAQAVESLWSVNSTDESRAYSISALELIFENFADSVKKVNKINRAAMQKAAFLSGKAIDIAQTTAAHAISYPLTAHYGISHGLAVFLMLPMIFEYNLGTTHDDCLDSRGVDFVKAIMEKIAEKMGCSVKDGRKKLESYFEIFNIPSKLKDYGVRSEEELISVMKSGVNLDRLKNNPRSFDSSGLYSMIGRLL